MKLAGVRRYARMRKWNLETVPAGSSALQVAQYRARFKPAGMIVESCNTPGVAWKEDSGKTGRVGVVYLDTDPELAHDAKTAVVCDQAAVAETAFAEFAALKLQSVAYAGWFERRFWSRARGAAFAGCARRANARCDMFEPDFGLKKQMEYEEALGRFLQSLPSPAGLFAANDKIASIALASCRRLGIAVPQEIAVLGVDNDVQHCENEMPSLSSIQLDFEQAGFMAAGLLDSLIHGGGGAGNAVFGPLGVMRRESTRAFARMNANINKAMNLIREKACEGLKASDVAKAIGGSRRLAEIRFREATGKSILEEIQRVRFEKIFFLLARTAKPIGAIADFCGYKSPETLRRLFQQRTGLSMREWRKKHSRDAAGN